MYIGKDHLMALRAVRDYAGADDLVLADMYSSNMIPGIALRRVFIGHGIETINFIYKNDILTQFGTSKDQEERISILKNNQELMIRELKELLPSIASAKINIPKKYN